MKHNKLILKITAPSSTKKRKTWNNSKIMQELFALKHFAWISLPYLLWYIITETHAQNPFLSTLQGKNDSR